MIISDNLENILSRINETDNDKEKINLYVALAIDLQYEDKTRAEEYYKDAASIGRSGSKEDPSYLPLLAGSLKHLGRYYREIGEYDKALTNLEESLEAAEGSGDPSLIADLLDNIGTIYAYTTNFDEALKYYFKALRMAQNAKNKVRESEILNDIGYTLVILGYHEEALTYLLEGLGIIQAGNDLDMIQTMENSLCNAYLGLGDYDKALKHGLHAVQLSESLNNPNSEIIIRVSIAKIYLVMGEEEKAFKTLQKGYDLAEKYNFPREKSMASKLLGEIYLNQGDLDQAKEYLDISLDLANQLELPWNIYEIHKTLTEYHKKRGDFEQALNHFETYNKLKETSQHDQAINLFRSQFLEIQIQEAKRDAEIYQQNIELLTKEIEKSQQLQSKLHKMAITDSLTKLNNRGHFFNLAETWMGIAQKNDYPLSIIMMDIDHFKQVNDKNGHRVGDQVLEELARRIQASLRNQDISGRYGGEEFIALLPETDMKDAKQIAKRLHKKITKMPYKTDKLDLEIKISLGVASLTDHESMDLEELIDNADQALYEAKEKGRNQIKIFEK